MRCLIRRTLFDRSQLGSICNLKKKTVNLKKRKKKKTQNEEHFPLMGLNPCFHDYYFYQWYFLFEHLEITHKVQKRTNNKPT